MQVADVSIMSGMHTLLAAHELTSAGTSPPSSLTQLGVSSSLPLTISTCFSNSLVPGGVFRLQQGWKQRDTPAIRRKRN
jgi:hypothetical protein